MHNLTPEQSADFESRVKIVDSKIIELLKENQLGIQALPAFQDIENGKCVAIGITKYYDTKFKEEKKENVPTA